MLFTEHHEYVSELSDLKAKYIATAKAFRGEVAFSIFISYGPDTKDGVKHFMKYYDVVSTPSIRIM